MSTIIMVFGFIFIVSSFTFLSRQNIKRLYRQRKALAVLAQLRQVSER